MFEIAAVLIGLTFVMLGWYWGGITESRATAVAIGIPAIMLAGITIFAGDVDVPTWAFAATGAVFGGLAALGAYWEEPADRTVGLFALFFAFAAALIAGALVREADEFTNQALSATLVVIVAGFVFISSALTPALRGFRNFVGWVTLFGGAVIAFFGLAEALDIVIAG